VIVEHVERQARAGERVEEGGERGERARAVPRPSRTTITNAASGSWKFVR
jgi:hypothetical protein